MTAEIRPWFTGTSSCFEPIPPTGACALAGRRWQRPPQRAQSRLDPTLGRRARNRRQELVLGHQPTVLFPNQARRDQHRCPFGGGCEHLLHRCGERLTLGRHGSA